MPERLYSTSSLYSTLAPRVSHPTVRRSAWTCVIIALLVCIMVGVSYTSVKLSFNGSEMHVEMVPQAKARNLSTTDGQLESIVNQLEHIEQLIDGTSLAVKNLIGKSLKIEKVSTSIINNGIEFSGVSSLDYSQMRPYFCKSLSKS